MSNTKIISGIAVFLGVPCNIYRVYALGSQFGHQNMSSPSKRDIMWDDMGIYCNTYYLIYYSKFLFLEHCLRSRINFIDMLGVANNQPEMEHTVT